jgi:hypothetical protein
MSSVEGKNNKRNDIMESLIFKNMKYVLNVMSILILRGINNAHNT